MPTNHEDRFANEEEIAEMERKAEKRFGFVVAVERTINSGNLAGHRVTDEFRVPTLAIAEKRVRSIIANKDKFESELNETIHDVSVRIRLRFDSDRVNS